MNSCQENRPGIAWIQFFDVLDATEFLNIVAGEYDGNFQSLYNRIRQAWEPTDQPVQGIWEFDLRPTDLSVRQSKVDENTLDEEADGPPDFLFHVSVRFPQTDIPILLRRMQNHNAACQQA
ncbi:MAG: hypothetical protein O3A29_22835 [Planctomycetota bacterium]|nr:hypothetical protein [Planctomycetota bacterium]